MTHEYLLCDVVVEEKTEIATHPLELFDVSDHTYTPFVKEREENPKSPPSLLSVSASFGAFNLLSLGRCSRVVR